MPRSLLWPDPRVKPPFGAAEIDWGHPLARELVVCLLFNEQAGIPQDSGPYHATTGKSPSLAWKATSQGPGVAFIDTDMAIDLFDNPFTQFGTGAFSALIQ